MGNSLTRFTAISGQTTATTSGEYILAVDANGGPFQVTEIHVGMQDSEGLIEVVTALSANVTKSGAASITPTTLNLVDSGDAYETAPAEVAVAGATGTISVASGTTKYGPFPLEADVVAVIPLPLRVSTTSSVIVKVTPDTNNSLCTAQIIYKPLY